MEKYIENTEKSEIEALEGSVEYIIYSNEENGYTVIEIGSDEEVVVCVGTMPDVNVGEELEITGYYKYHYSYGKQFVVQIYQRKLPSTENAIIKYLSSVSIFVSYPNSFKTAKSTFGLFNNKEAFVPSSSGSLYLDNISLFFSLALILNSFKFSISFSISRSLNLFLLISSSLTKPCS